MAASAAMLRCGFHDRCRILAPKSIVSTCMSRADVGLAGPAKDHEMAAHPNKAHSAPLMKLMGSSTCVAVEMLSRDASSATSELDSRLNTRKTLLYDPVMIDLEETTR